MKYFFLDAVLSSIISHIIDVTSSFSSSREDSFTPNLMGTIELLFFQQYNYYSLKVAYATTSPWFPKNDPRYGLLFLLPNQSMWMNFKKKKKQVLKIISCTNGWIEIYKKVAWSYDVVAQFKVILMQIWKSPYMFLFKQK